MPIGRVINQTIRSKSCLPHSFHLA